MENRERGKKAKTENILENCVINFDARLLNPKHSYFFLIQRIDDGNEEK